MSLTAWRRRPPDHTVTQNDNSIPLEDILRDNKGNLVNLTGCSVQYQARMPGATTLDIDRAGTIVGDPLNGHVRVTLLAADLDAAGDLVEQWRITFGGGAIERFPAVKHKLRIGFDAA